MSHLVSSINWDILMSTLITPICLLVGAIMFTWWLISATYWELSRVLISLLEVMRPDLCVLNKKQIIEWRQRYAESQTRAQHAESQMQVLQKVLSLMPKQNDSATYADFVDDFRRALAQRDATIRDLEAQVTTLKSKEGQILTESGLLTEYGARACFKTTLDTLRDANRTEKKTHRVAAITIDLRLGAIDREYRNPQVYGEIRQESTRRLLGLRLRPSDIVTEVNGEFFLVLHHIEPSDVKKVVNRIRNAWKQPFCVTRPGSREPLSVKVTPAIRSTSDSINPNTVLGADAWFRRLLTMTAEAIDGVLPQLNDTGLESTGFFQKTMSNVAAA